MLLPSKELLHESGIILEIWSFIFQLMEYIFLQVMDDLTSGLCDTDIKVSVRPTLKHLAVLVKEASELFSELLQARKQKCRRKSLGYVNKAKLDVPS